MSHDIKTQIRALARAAGFDAAGFTSPDLPAAAAEGLRQFLDLQHHGDMEWMETHADRRVSPRRIWPDVQSILVLGHNYAPDHDPMEKLSHSEQGNISCYAQGDDYHDVIKKKLKALARSIAGAFETDVKVFVDTAPVMEKPLAQQAGIGWQGKHTCLVSREFGSWLFLGEIFLSMALPPDDAEDMHCGSCTSCLDICPTQAFTGPGQIDARKCISYLTIEHKGHIDRQFRKAMGNRIYGCDDCLAVCPWNKFAQSASEAAYHPRDALRAPLLAELLQLDDAAFRSLFAQSPIKRIGRDRFIRNVLIASGNHGDPAFLSLIEPLLADPSPLVRAMAVWALSQIATPDGQTARASHHMPHESDAHVLEEWRQALST